MGDGESYQKSNNFFLGLFFVNTGAIRTLSQWARTGSTLWFAGLEGYGCHPAHRVAANRHTWANAGRAGWAALRIGGSAAQVPSVIGYFVEPGTSSSLRKAVCSGAISVWPG